MTPGSSSGGADAIIDRTRLPAGLEHGVAVLRRRGVLLAALLIVDLAVVAASSLHVLVEQGRDIRPSFENWYVEDPDSYPNVWQAGQAGLAAIALAVVWATSRSRGVGLLALALVVVAAAYGTRPWTDLLSGSGVGGIAIGLVLVATCLVAVMFSPTAPAVAVALATATFVVLGGVLDVVTSRTSGSSFWAVTANIEGGVEMISLSVVLVLALDAWASRRPDASVDQARW